MSEGEGSDAVGKRQERGSEPENEKADLKQEQPLSSLGSTTTAPHPLFKNSSAEELQPGTPATMHERWYLSQYSFWKRSFAAGGASAMYVCII